MNRADSVSKIVQWARTTDLAEISYRREDAGVGFRLEHAPTAPPPLPGCALIAGRAPTVGLFRFSALGSAAKLEPGVQVAEGDVLGHVEAGKKTSPVQAPASGKISSVHVEDGKPVQYGQALFFIQP